MLPVALIWFCEPQVVKAFPKQSQPAEDLGFKATAEAQRFFDTRHVTGAIVIQDVKTGEQLVSFPSDSGDFLPLSVVKLFLFASYWEHRDVLPASVVADSRELIAEGSDSAGRRLALALRDALGSRALLGDLERFGFPHCSAKRPVDCTTLSGKTPNADWVNAMSIGESGFRVTLQGLSRFLLAIGNRGFSNSVHTQQIMRTETSQQLQSAMLDTVRIGTARGIRDSLGPIGQIGGKTGTGPADARPYDGIFAALVFDSTGAPRYTIVTYVRRAGQGGGVAADISAGMAGLLLRTLGN